MFITDIKAPKGANRKRKNLGRGPGSGHGKTSGRGHKGTGQRSGPGVRPGFEGGSMPLIRRMPKRGFRAYPKTPYSIINIQELNKFSKGTTVTPLSLKEAGLIKNEKNRIKLLGDGKLEKTLSIKVHAASESAKKKIEESGSSLELIQAA